MTTPRQFSTLLIAALTVTTAPTGLAAPRVSHHGGPILHCEPPQFFNLTPGKDARVSSVQDFSVTASDNTDRNTIKLWANNEPQAVTITEERSGRLLVQGRLKSPVTTGKVWFRISAESHDGCDDYRAWNVYAGD